jgi:hypothetical protein
MKNSIIVFVLLLTGGLPAVFVAGLPAIFLAGFACRDVSSQLILLNGVMT